MPFAMAKTACAFLGYNSAPFKVVVFAIGGAFAGIAGALFTLHVGVISPAMIGVVPSIEMVVWVAVGGRKSLLGAIAGTLLVNFGKDWISSAMPELWLFVMGFLFVVVVLVLPQGLAGVKDLGVSIFHRRGRGTAATSADVDEPGIDIISEHGFPPQRASLTIERREVGNE